LRKDPAYAGLKLAGKNTIKNLIRGDQIEESE
jgi:hypothetical protein